MINPYSDAVVAQKGNDPVVKDFGNEQYAEPPSWDFNSSGLYNDPEMAAASVTKRFNTFQNIEERAALTAKAKNTAMFSNLLRISPDQAWQMHDYLIGKVYPNEMLSSETFWGNMKMVYDQKKIEQEIAMLRYAQLEGDSSPGTNNRIIALEASQPSKSELDRVLAGLSDEYKTIPEKIVEAVKGTPYFVASQVPMWINQARHGAVGAVGGAITFGAAGAVGAPVTAATGAIVGSIAGSARYEFMMEAGLAYEQMLNDAYDAGVKIDQDIARKYAKISGGLITAIDHATLLFGGGSILKGSGKVVAETMEKFTKQSVRQIMKASIKDVAKATAGEAIGEGIQEVIGGVTSNLAYELNELKGNGYIDKVSSKEILRNAETAMLMASMTATIASGLGSAFVAGKTVRNNIQISKTKNSIALVESLKNKSVEEIQSISEKIESGEAVTIEEAVQASDQGFKYERSSKGVKSDNWEIIWSRMRDKYNLQRPDYITKKSLGAQETYDVNGNSRIAKVTTETITNKDGVKENYIAGESSFGNGEPVKVRGKVFQGDVGLEISFDEDYAIGSEQWYLKQKVIENLNEVYTEGVDLRSDEYMNFPESIKKNIDMIETVRETLGDENVTYLRKTEDLANIMEQMSNELENYEEGTVEYQILKQAMYEYGMMRAQYRVKSTTAALKGTINFIRQMINDRTLMVQRIHKSQSIMENKYKVTLPLDKNEKKRVAKIIKSMEEAKTKGRDNFSLTEEEQKLLKRSKMKTIKEMPFNELNKMVKELESNSFAGEREVALRYGDTYISLDKAAAISAIEIKSSIKNIEAKNSPMEVQKNPMKQKLLNGAYKMIKISQRQYHWLIGELAGRESVTYAVLYRNLRKSDKEFFVLKEKLMAKFREDVEAAGIERGRIWKWGQETIDTRFNGMAFSKSQASSIYLHSLCEQNYESITDKGMTYYDLKGRKVEIPPEVINEIIEEVSHDEETVAISKIFSKTYERLLPAIANNFKRIWGKEFEVVENYFPQMVDPQVWRDTRPNPFEVKSEDIMTTTKGFLYERTGNTNPLLLESVFDTINRSIHQEAKFAKMELALYQAQSVLFDPKVENAIKDLKNGDYYETIKSGIRAEIGYQHQHGSILDSPLMHLRSNVVKGVIGLNPFVAIKAPTSWVYGLQYVSPEFMFKGLIANASDGQYKSNVEFFMDVSPGFRQRILGGNIAEYADIISGKETSRMIKTSGKSNKLSLSYDDVIFAPVKFMDKHTVSAVMTGAYLQAKSEISNGHVSKAFREATGYTDDQVIHLSPEQQEAAAIAFAEDVMDISQPSFNVLNRNAFQRGSAIERFFSVYGSFTTITHNMILNAEHAYRVQGAAALPLIGTTLGLWALTSVGNAAVDQLRQFLTGKEKIPYWKMVSQALLGNTFILRDVEGAITSRIQFGFTGGNSFIPAEDILNELIDSGNYLLTSYDYENKEFKPERFNKGLGLLGSAVGKASGIPVTPFKYTSDIVNAWATGNDDWKEEWKIDGQ